MPSSSIATPLPRLQEEHPAAPAESFVQNAWGDRYLYSVNRHAFDRFGAKQTFERVFANILDEEDTLYIVAGSDSGLLYEYIRERPRPAGSRYLLIELEDIHTLLLQDGRCQADDETILCTDPKHWLDAARTMHLSEYLYLDAVKVVPSIAAQDQHHPQYTELAWQLKEEVDKLRWQAVASLGSESFIICQLQNAADNIHSAHILRQAFAGKTAVLLAGGPSLDALLPWVSAHRDRLAVLAVSRIAGRLLEVGMTPDFVFSVDPTEMSYDISKAMFAFDERTTLIHQYHIAPRLLAQWPHRALYLGPILPWQSRLNPRQPLYTPGPTVTNTAIQVAFEFGFRTIILAGVDLCFTAEGYTHALGSNERAAGPRFDLTHLEVETYAGHKASTTPDFASAIETLALQARQLTSMGCTLVNPSPHAAKIEAILHQPIDDIPIPSEIIDIPSTLHKLLPSLKKNQHLTHYRKLSVEFSRIQHELKTIHDLIDNAIHINDSMFDPAASQQENAGKKRNLDKIEKTLNKKHAHLSLIIKHMGLRSMLRAMRPFADYESMDAKAIREIGHDYYATYLEGTQRLMRILEDAKERLDLRLREEETDTAFDNLASAWKSHAIPGRVRVWEKRHPERIAQLTEEERGLREALEQEFREDIERKLTAHMARAKAHADLGAARIRARQLFAQRKITALEGLCSALKKHHDHAQGQALILLVEGYIHELRGDMTSALANYAKVLAHEDLRATEDALLRMADWSLGQGLSEQSLHALQCLASISEQYILQYAEMLRIAGEPLKAVEAYQHHIARFPDDTHAKIRLVRHLLDYQAYEGAQLVLQNMLGDKSNDENVRALWEELKRAAEGS